MIDPRTQKVISTCWAWRRFKVGRATEILTVSILMYRTEGCAVLRRADLRCAMPRLCSMALRI
eukprot:9492404-Pyramimonas_sp.AAC.1